MAKFSVGQIVKPIGKPHKRPLKALPECRSNSCRW